MENSRLVYRLLIISLILAAAVTIPYLIYDNEGKMFDADDFAVLYGVAVGALALLQLTIGLFLFLMLVSVMWRKALITAGVILLVICFVAIWIGSKIL